MDVNFDDPMHWMDTTGINVFSPAGSVSSRKSSIDGSINFSSAGFVSISGAGSMRQTASAFSTGTLAIRNGASAPFLNEMSLGRRSGGSGILTVDGNTNGRSSLFASGGLTVGSNFAGTMASGAAVPGGVPSTRVLGPNAVVYYTESPAAGSPGPTESYNGNPYGTVIYYGYSSAFLISAPPVLAVDNPNAYGGNIRSYVDPGAGGFTQQGFSLGDTISQFAAGVPGEAGTVIYTLLSGPTTYYAPVPTSRDTVTFGYLGPDGPRVGPPQHPNLPPGMDAYTVALGGGTFAETDAGFFNAPDGAGITFTLSGTYTSTELAKLEGQMITFTGNGTFATPKLVVAGNVNVTGGTLSGDQFFVDDASNTAATTTTLTLDGAGAKLAARTFLTVGFATTGASTVILRNGASGTAGNVFLGTGGEGSKGVLILDNGTLTTSGFLQVGQAAGSQGQVTVKNAGQLTTTDSAIGFGGGASASSVTVDGTGSTWTAKGFIQVGANGPADATHQLIVRNGAEVTSENYLVIGGVTGSSTGSGRLSILGGGKVTSGTTLNGTTLAAAVGFGDNSAGAATIDGTDSTWDIKARLNVGYGVGSTGTVTVQNGGILQVEGDRLRLGRDAAATGTLTFDKAGGANPTLTFNGGNGSQLLVGDNGTGNLNVRGGAQITANAAVILGNAASATGNATVRDPGSSLTVNGDLTIGLGGTGNFTIQDGNTATVNGSVAIGEGTGSHGKLTIDGPGSNLSITTAGVSAQPTIGGAGTGTLAIQNGASVTFLNEVSLGEQSGGSGIITVDGSANGRSSLFANGGLTVGENSAGVAASGGNPATPGGRLVITGGALVRTTGDLTVGDSENSTGEIQISGAGSELQIQNGSFIVGGVGNGKLRLDNSATLTVGAMTLGFTSGSTASVADIVGTSSGGQTHLTVNGNFLVGRNGTGTLNLSAGAILTTNSGAFLGASGSSMGTVNLSGANTLWQATQGLGVGDQGMGVLNIKSGARLETTVLGLGATSGSGTVTVDGTANGTASTLNVSGNINVGQGASAQSASLTVQNGASVEAGALSFNGKNATLTVSGADPQSNSPSTLHADSVSVLATTATLRMDINGGARVDLGGGDLALIGSVSSILNVGIRTTVLSAPSVTLRVGSGGSAVATATFSDGATIDTADATISGANATVSVSGTQAAPTAWTIHQQGIQVLALDTGGKLSVLAGGTVNVLGQTLVGANSTLSVTGAADTTAMFTTAGLTVDGRLSVGANSQVSSTANTPFGDAFVVNNGGMISLANDGARLSGASLTIRGGGQLIATGGTANIGSRVVVSTGGRLDLSSGGSLNVGFVLNQAGATQISVGAGGSLKNFGDVYVSQVNIGVGGIVGGSGNFHGAIINGGTVNPLDPQTLTISGNYTQLNGGLLQVAVAGTAQAAMDHLVVTGQLSLQMGSHLQVDFINGFAPHLGDAFSFLSFGTLDPTGNSFSQVDVTGLAPGFLYTVSLDPGNAGSFILTALNDGVATTVPEPSTWALLAAGGLLASFLRLRRQALQR